MNFVETLISERLKIRNPMLDIYGSDRKVLHIACQDFTNYLKVFWGIIGRDGEECELVNKLERLWREDPAELEEFIDVWTGIWLKKWMERVKLLISDEDQRKWNRMSKILINAEPIWRRLTNRREMQEVVITTLIKNGEICGTSILAENLLKMELSENKRKHAKEEEQILNVVNKTLRKARELTRSKGPLIFVKLDRSYYSSNI